MHRKVAALVATLILIGTTLSAQEAPKVSTFSPQGVVKKVRQARAVFSEAMVPFGDPRLSVEPFETACSEAGQGRWVDPRNWVYDFARDLPGGVRCTFRLRPGLRSLAGRDVAGPTQFEFSTGGPAIRRSVPYAGQKGISEDQVFILVLDGAPDEDTVAERAGFAVSGIQQRIGARIVRGEDREAILAAHPWLFNDGTGRERVVLLQCRQRFPQKAKVSLLWGKGIASASGVATGQDQVLHFETRENFAAEFGCERENARAGCIPVLSMSLSFNAPLNPQTTGEATLKGPEGKVWRAPLGTDRRRLTFDGPFPANAEFQLEIPADLTDDSGRPLANAKRFPLKVRTAGFPALAKFAARFGIVELHADPALPVTLRSIEPQPKARVLNVHAPDASIAGQVTGRVVGIPPGRVEDIQPWLRKVAAADRETSVFAGGPAARELKIPKLQGAGATEVVGIPLRNAGLYVVEFESAILGRALLDPPKPMYVPTAVLVTNLAVHFKQGRESSLAWVTTLDKAEPVAGAAVSVMDCAGRILWTGRTDADGVARIEAELPTATEEAECRFDLPAHDYAQLGALSRIGTGVFVTAQTADDMSFVHSSWEDGIEAWRFKLPEEYGAGPIIAHTVFDRSLLRAGETVHMKHVVRHHTREGFTVPPAERLPKGASIHHSGSGQTYRMPLSWDAAGVAETEWSIPRDAKLGSYTVTLRSPSGPEDLAQPPAGEGADASADPPGDEDGSSGLTSGRFRVEEFRVPLLKGTIQPPAEPIIAAGEVPLDLSVHYLAGGGAALLPVKLRTEVTPKRTPVFEGFEDFVFGNGAVREGLTRRGDPEDAGEDSAGDDRPAKRRTTELVLDSAGGLRTVVSGLPHADVPQEMTAELEFRDPNGEVQTVSGRIPIWSAGYLVGLKPDGWAASRDTLKLRAAVVDLAGNPVRGARVRIDAFERKVMTHRKRLVGGFYGYDHTIEVKRVGALAEGLTDASGLMTCEARSPVSGEVLLVAESRDPAGRPTFANRSVWVAGAKDWWFEASDDDRMDLIPERKRYEPGETAVFQVRMPFREATALVSVEREGVLETRIRKLSGRDPVIEVPIQGRHAPNIFVSVLAVRGRTGEAQPTALADLGKPAFKLGIAEVRVGWREHELKVSVTADRSVYKVREKVNVSIRAATSDGKAPPAGSEVALAAVDEGLLELSANSSWDLLPAMMGRRPYEVRTATAQMQVVGKRHFGVKALPAGGGGGRHVTRELFDTLLVWKGRVPLDERGEAEVVVPLNDTLSAFRIVAVATGGAGFFGTGATTVRSTQDLMLFSGLAPLVREGDRYRAGVTVRNTAARDVTVQVSARAGGAASPPPAPQTLALAAGAAHELFWEVEAPRGAGELIWDIDAAAKESGAQDHLRVVQRVLPAVPLRVFQAELVQLEKRLALPVERPRDALPGGGLRVSVRARLGDGLKGVADYMRRYPYGCMEQKVSMAVALRDATLWERWMAQMPAHIDSDGLVKYFPTQPSGDPVLTAYLISVSHEAGWTISADLLRGMTDGLRRFVEGRLARRSPLPTADLTVRKLAALAALTRTGTIEPALIGSLVIEPNLWPTSAVIDWVDILSAVPDIPNRTGRLADAEQVLRARLVYQGTRLAFSTEASDSLWWLMVSNDLNAVRLVLTAMRLDGWRPDLPQLVRGALARQRHGHWDLTTANAWGVLAMERFSERYESGEVDGTTRLDLAGQSRAVDWGSPLRADSLIMTWPPEKADLAVEHQGAGRPWLTVQGLAAVPLKAPLASGYTIRKAITAVERRAADRWSRGDILRVRLEIDAAADMTWVAVSDPVPAGAAILGSGLGRDSRLLTATEDRMPRVWPTYEERSYEAFRAYYDHVPKGSWALEYVLRLNQAGTLSLPPTRVEALYAPEVFGEIPNEAVVVQP